MTPPGHDFPKAVPILLLAGLMAYANSGMKAFVFDDNLWIIRNPDVGNLSAALSGTRPLIVLSLFANYKVGGFSPVGYHAVNVGIHLLAGLTLFGLVRRTLILPRFAGRYDATAGRLAFAVALLWLLHPLNTQAVTYIIQRCESLMGLFYLLALYAWLRGATADRFRWLWYAVTPLCLWLSGLCKEVAVTLPPVLLLFDRIFLSSTWSELIRRRWAGYLTVFAVEAWLLRGVLGLATSSEAGAGGVGFQVKAATPWQYLLTQTEVLLHYLRLAVLPIGQSLDYRDWPFAESLAEVWPAGLAVVGLGLLTIWLLFKRPAIGFLGAWFFLILAPTSSIMPIIDAAFEHRMYLPLAGLLVGVVMAADWVGRRWAVRPQVVWLVLIGVAVTLGGLTARRNTVYANQESVWRDVADKRPRSFRPKAAVAEQLIHRGQLAEADGWLARAEAIRPTDAMVIFIRGLYHDRRGEYAEAARRYAPVTDLDAGYVSRTAFEQYGRLRLAEGKPAEAAELFRRGTAVAPTSADLWFLLAASELAAGRPDPADEAWRRAIALNPAVWSPYVAENRAVVLSVSPTDPKARKPIPAVAVVARFAAEPDPVALDVHAIELASAGRFPEAEQAARRGAEAATAQSNTVYATALADRAEWYRAKQAYRPRLAGVPVKEN